MPARLRAGCGFSDRYLQPSISRRRARARNAAPMGWRERGRRSLRRAGRAQLSGSLRRELHAAPQAAVLSVVAGALRRVSLRPAAPALLAASALLAAPPGL